MAAGSVFESEVHRKGSSSAVDLFILFADTVKSIPGAQVQFGKQGKVNGVIPGTYQQHWGKIRTLP